MLLDKTHQIHFMTTHLMV